MINKVTIDRFEGRFAVCETENRMTVHILKVDVPEKAQEGDILVRGDENQLWTVDTEETESRREAMRNKLNSLFEN